MEMFRIQTETKTGGLGKVGLNRIGYTHCESIILVPKVVSEF